VIRQIIGDNRPSTDNAMVSDGDSHQNHGVRTYEGAVTDAHRQTIQRDPAVGHASARAGVRVDVDASGDVAGTSDLQTA
jgi:hypothetical protein